MRIPSDCFTAILEGPHFRSGNRHIIIYKNAHKLYFINIDTQVETVNVANKQGRYKDFLSNKIYSMDHIKKIFEIVSEETADEELSWKQFTFKQGYLINFHRGLLKAPKMQYFVLTANGLISFESKPHHDTKPLCFLPYEQLSSIKLDHIELDSCKISCLQLTSKTTPSFTLGFSRTEERDDWMMIIMKAFSEALLEKPVFCKTTSTIDEDKPQGKDDFAPKEKLGRTVSNESYGQTLRRKRRKGNRGSIRRSKSLDMLAFNSVTKAAGLAYDTSSKSQSVDPLRPEDESAPTNHTRKRKSEPDVIVISHFPSAWTTDNIKEKPFASSCSFEHRDSLTVQAEKLLKNKSDSKHKSTSMLAKIRSKLEHPVLFVH